MFGSVVNRLLEVHQAEPEIGMGATELGWTDRHAGTIVEVHKAKTGKRKGQATRVGWQQDRAERIGPGGPSEVQRYEYQPDPEAAVVYFTLRRNERWIHEGSAMADGVALTIGRRDEYYDYSF